MDIAPEQAGIGLIAVVIIVVIAAVVLSSGSAFDPFKDWFSSFGKSKWQTMCVEDLKGEWCSSFYECHPDYKIAEPQGFESENRWKCCQPGHCVPSDIVDQLKPQTQDSFEGLSVEFYLQEGTSERIDILTNRPDIELYYGERNNHDAVFTISHPDGKRLSYELTSRERKKQSDGSLQPEGLLASGTADGSTPTTVRVPLNLGYEDMYLKLRVWNTDNENEEFIRRVPIKLIQPPGNTGMVIEDAMFKFHILDNSAETMFVYGTGVNKQEVITVPDGVSDADAWCEARCRSHGDICVESYVIPAREYIPVPSFWYASYSSRDSCQYTHRDQKDFKIQKDSGKWFVYIWDSGQWKMLDCENVWGPWTHRLNMDNLKESFTDTLNSNCVSGNNYSYA